MTISTSVPPFVRQTRRPARYARSWALLLPLALFLPQAATGASPSLPTGSPGAPRQTLESPVEYSSVLYRSGNRRDPFINPLLYKKTGRGASDEEISRGLPPPGIRGTYIAQATLQGIAMRDGRHVAVLRGADSRAYFLRKGDRLFDGYLKDIREDSVTLVRETRMRSGKFLTQDVIKRLRTP